MRRGARVADMMGLLGCKNLRELAARVGVHYSTLSLWQRGKVEPTPRLRAQVCERMGGMYAEAWLFPLVPHGEEGAA